MENIELNKNVSLTMINTSQFKDILLTVRFLCPLTRKNGMIRSILAQMLQDRCAAWPTKQALSEHLDELYGATVITKASSYGQCLAFEYRFKCLNDQYTNENTFERLFKTAHEFIFNPLMKDGQLDCELFEEARREVVFANQRKLDQPHARAIEKACAIMGKDQALAEMQLVTEEEINAITLQEVTDMVQQMLHQDQIMIFVIGKIDKELSSRYVQRFMPFDGRDIVVDSAYVLKPVQQQIEQEEIAAIDQTMLVMMYNSDINIVSQDYWKMRVANGLFGQLPTSLLFQEVREKRSLCYSISSNAMPYEGAVICSTGIQKSRIDEVKNCIEQQLKRMQKGDFSDDDLETSIKMLKNAVLASYDDPNSIINFAFQNALLNQDMQVEDCIKAIELTTRKDVVRLFSQLKLAVIFCLKQEEQNESAY